jgi:hypothetical protein
MSDDDVHYFKDIIDNLKDYFHEQYERQPTFTAEHEVVSHRLASAFHMSRNSDEEKFKDRVRRRFKHLITAFGKSKKKSDYDKLVEALDRYASTKKWTKHVASTSYMGSHPSPAVIAYEDAKRQVASLARAYYDARNELAHLKGQR